METLVILVVICAVLLSLQRRFSPMRAAEEIGRVGSWFAHEGDLDLAERPDAGVNDPPIPRRPLRGRD